MIAARTVQTVILCATLVATTAQTRAADEDAVSFITVRLEKCSDDGAGNEQDDIVVTNTHASRAIRVTVRWISVAHERENDAYLKPGQKRSIAHDQTNAREVHVTRAEFR